MKKIALLVFLLSCACWGQSITVATSNCSTGFTCTFTPTLTSLPSANEICYAVDAFYATNPGFGALANIGCTKAPFVYTYNTNETMNGSHIVNATVYDAGGTIIATTASPGTFTTANTYPVQCNDGSGPAFTVTTGTATTASWSGSVTITVQATGSCATDNLKFRFLFDDIPFAQPQSSTAGAPVVVTLITTRFLDSTNHVLAITGEDKTNNTVFGPNTMDGALEWSRIITTSNGAVASTMWTGSHDWYLTPGSAFTMPCSIINADQTVGTPVNCDFISTNTAVATVNASTGVGAVANPLPAQGTNAQILTMAETISCSDLAISGVNATEVTSATCPFDQAMVTGQISWIINIKSGTGFTPGLYQISSYLGGGIVQLKLPGQACCATVGTLGATGGTFATGPTRNPWILAATTNVVYHFGTDNLTHSTYDPLHSIIPHSMFSSAGLVGNEAPVYSPGIGSDLTISGFNTLERGIPNFMRTYATQAAFQTSINTDITGWQQALASKSMGKTIYAWLDGSNMVSANSDAFASTVSSIPPMSTWTTSAVQYLFQAWGLKAIGMTWQDEAETEQGAFPLAGPIKFSNSPLGQGSIASITSTGSACTVNTLSSFSIVGGFILQGATTAGLNTVNPTINASTASFACTAAAGTYNAASDVNLILQQYWNTWETSTAGLPYNWFAILRTQHDLATNGAPAAFSISAAGSGTARANLSTNSTQSIGGVTKVSNFADLYSSHGTSEQYVASRTNLNAVINDNQNLGYFARVNFGYYDPGSPIVWLTQGTSVEFGFQPYTLPGTWSCVNELCTSTQPHGVTNIIPGLTRLSIAGSNNAAYNTNFYVIEAPTAFTLRVVLAAMDFADSITSAGTWTFADGTTIPLTAEKSTGSIQLAPGGGDHVTYNGATVCGATGCDSVSKRRCQTGTISGITGGNAAWNTRTFSYGCENLIHATDGNGTLTGNMWIRELPTGTATGGTVSILYDNNFIPGRQSDTQLLREQPEVAFGQTFEDILVGGSADRFYKGQNGWQDYSNNATTVLTGGPAGGWLGFALSFAIVFNEATTINQLQGNPGIENYRAVPMFKGASMADKFFSGRQKYLLGANKLNSPDYGPEWSCGIRQSTFGKVLLCWNASNAPQTRKFDYSPLLTTGQTIIRTNASANGIEGVTLVTANTANETLTYNSGEGFMTTFPANFTGEINEPVVPINRASVTGATKSFIHYAYDPYLLDAVPTNTVSCGSAAYCTLPADPNFGTIFYYIILTDNTNKVLSQSSIYKY